MNTSTIVTAAVGAAVTGTLAYAVYFDHRRRTDPEFRRSLKRSARQQARVDKEAARDSHQEAVQAMVEKIEAEPVPSPEEAEQYFMHQLSQGEALSGEGESKALEAAACLFRALRSYAQPQQLMAMFDQLIPAHTLNALAEMLAVNPDIVKGSSRDGSVIDD